MQRALFQKIVEYVRAGYAAFYLKTVEIERANSLVEKLSEELKMTVLEYNLACGKVDFKHKFQKKDNEGKMENSFKDLYDEDLEDSLIFIRNAKFSLEHNPLAISRLQYLIEKIERHNRQNPKQPCMIVLQSAEVCIPVDIEPYITLLELPLPTESEIKQIIQQFDNHINEIQRGRLSTALSGLNELEIQKVLLLVKNRFTHISEENQSDILTEIQQQKEQIIAKSGVLEMVKISHSISDIGGLENLKKWLRDQSLILNQLDEALQFGVKAPKGTLIAGMPGCGKSLTAKAAAALFQQPLLRLDIGSLLGKYVGESETNMRKALAMAESISPCVLWVDELEKAFVGMSGNNSSEVSSRLLGYFLTWMQEKTKPVFIIATANDITALPPELLRKGRFDEIFYVGFPNRTERQQILSIHLEKAKQNSGDFDLVELARLCRDYSGADMENAVYDAVKTAFLSSKKQLTQYLLIQEIKRTVPLRKTLKEKVGQYEEKFETLHLTPASEEDGLTIPQMIKMAKDPNYLERKKVAESEDVTEDILGDLVTDKVLEVRKAAFSNPTCPAKLLNKQLQMNKEDASYDEDLLKIVVKHNNISEDLVLSHIKDKVIFNIFVSQKENFSEETLSRLVKIKESEVKLALINNQYIRIPDEGIRLLAEDEDPKVRKSVSRLNYIQDDHVTIQTILAKDPDKDVRLELVRHSVIPICREALDILLNDDNVEVRRALAELDTIKQDSKTIQLLLARDPSYSVRMALIKTHFSSLSEEALLCLAEREDLNMELAKLTYLPDSVQIVLVKTERYGVINELLSNDKITLCPEALRILAESHSWRTREKVASLTYLPEEIRHILANDTSFSVRTRLKLTF